MKSSEKNIQNLDSAFDNLFKDFENDYETEAKVLASKMLSGISAIADKRDLKRKNLAELIGTSASYLTQLYRGSKLLNFITLAKLKKKLDLNIEIKITENSYNETNADFNYKNLKKEISVGEKKTNWEIFKNLNPNNGDAFIGGEKNSIKIIKTQLTA